MMLETVKDIIHGYDVIRRHIELYQLGLKDDVDLGNGYTIETKFKFSFMKYKQIQFVYRLERNAVSPYFDGYNCNLDIENYLVDEDYRFQVDSIYRRVDFRDVVIKQQEAMIWMSTGIMVCVYDNWMRFDTIKNFREHHLHETLTDYRG